MNNNSDNRITTGPMNLKPYSKDHKFKHLRLRSSINDWGLYQKIKKLFKKK